MRGFPLALLTLLSLAATPLPAWAEAAITSKTLEIDLWSGFDEAEGEAALARATLRPGLKAKFGRSWRGELAVRLELAEDETGLGTVDTFSDLSRPLARSNTTRIEIDTATLTWRRSSTFLTLGKQTIPWGKLDGLQVTDRFDAVRRRDYVFTDVRPDRISRWGARLETDIGEWRADLALALDPTVNQLAQPGDRFSPTAPRQRAGLPEGVPLPPITVSDRDDIIEDATFGLRMTRRFDGGDVSLLALSGPDTDPVFAQGGTARMPEIRLNYPHRKLYGLTASRSAGSLVWRAEAALIPDQAVNIEVGPMLAIDERIRWLGGVGLDWDAPGGFFVNAQIAVDHIQDGPEPLPRPETDSIATLRAQKGFRNDTVYLKGEYIGSLSDGDGFLRPALEWRLDDQFTFRAGADIIFGDHDGLFGQFEDKSRAWVRMTWKL